jgi:hypothetical protein
MLRLDLPTLFLMVVALQLLIIALFVFYRFTLGPCPGLGFWIAGSASGALGIALLLLGSRVPVFVNAFLGTSLTMAAFDLYRRGLWRFLGRSARSSLIEWLFYGACLAVYTFFFVRPDVSARIVVVSVCAVQIMVQCALASRPMLNGPYRAEGFIIGIAALLSIAGNLLRGSAALAAGTSNARALLGRGSLEDAALFGIFTLILVAQLLVPTLVAQRLRVDLDQARGRVGQLEGLLPICTYCKRIRDEHEVWHAVEEYVGTRSQATFSHGVCPSCVGRLEADLK